MTTLFDTIHKLLGNDIGIYDHEVFVQMQVFFHSVHIQNLNIFHVQIWHDFYTLIGEKFILSNLLMKFLAINVKLFDVLWQNKDKNLLVV